MPHQGVPGQWGTLCSACLMGTPGQVWLGGFRGHSHLCGGLPVPGWSSTPMTIGDCDLRAGLNSFLSSRFQPIQTGRARVRASCRVTWGVRDRQLQRPPLESESAGCVSVQVSMNLVNPQGILIQPAVFLDNSLGSPGFQTGFLRGLETLEVPHRAGERD